LGSIAGDIAGSVYEYGCPKRKDLDLFGADATYTDDTVLSIAVADWLMSGGDPATYLRRYARRYPDAGYGGGFKTWMTGNSERGYGSLGNGSAMRVGPVAFAARTLDDALDLARRSAEPTHDHPEGIKGAQATATAMWLARHGADAGTIRHEVSLRFGYDMRPSVDAIRPGYGYDVTCPGTVPPALICALEATDYEDAVRNALSLGGDADTLACIAGGLAEILFGLPNSLARAAETRLPADLRKVVRRFRGRFVAPGLAARLAVWLGR